MTKTYLCIGAGPGIGLSTAERFANEGFRIVLTARDTARLETLAVDLQNKTGATVETATVDCIDNRSVKALIDRFNEGLEVLHFNAAALKMETLEDLSPDTLATDLQIDIVAAITAIQAALPYLSGHRSGTVLLTGGGLALTPSPDFLSVSLGKAGIRTIAQALFPPLAEQGVHLATLTIGREIKPGSEHAAAVAASFWELHAQTRSEWTWEKSYS